MKNKRNVSISNVFKNECSTQFSCNTKQKSTVNNCNLKKQFVNITMLMKLLYFQHFFHHTCLCHALVHAFTSSFRYLLDVTKTHGPKRRYVHINCSFIYMTGLCPQMHNIFEVIVHTYCSPRVHITVAEFHSGYFYIGIDLAMTTHLLISAEIK